MKHLQKPPVNRKRPIEIKFRVNEKERDLIRKKMQLIKTNNLAAYMRKMAIDGYIVEVDYSDLKAVCAKMQKIGININQIAKRVNNTNIVYKSDMAIIDASVKEIWDLLRLGFRVSGKTQNKTSSLMININ